MIIVIKKTLNFFSVFFMPMAPVSVFLIQTFKLSFDHFHDLSYTDIQMDI